MSSEEKPSGIGYGAIFGAVVVAIGIAVAINEFVLKDTTINTKIDSLQKALETLQIASNTQSTDIKGIQNLAKQTDIIIQGIIKDIAKSNSDILANNKEALRLINELKTSSEALKTSTQASDKTLQANIDIVQGKLDKFIDSIRSETKRIESKGDTNFNSINTKIDALLLNEKAENEKLKLMIEDTIAKDKARFEEIESQIPELKKTIEILKKENDAQVKLLQDDLLENSKTDSTYRDYVDKINTYIENALPEMSDGFKNKLFGTNNDLTLKLFDFKSNEQDVNKAKIDVINMRLQYVASQYLNVMGCKVIFESNGQFNTEKSINQIFKRMKETPNNSQLYELAFLCFARELLNGGSVTLNQTKMELIVKNDRGLAELFNKFLPVLGFSPLFLVSKGTPAVLEKTADPNLTKIISPEVPDIYSYPYLTSKKASEVFFRRFVNVKECEPLLDIIGSKAMCQPFNETIEKLAKCTS